MVDGASFLPRILPRSRRLRPKLRIITLKGHTPPFRLVIHIGAVHAPGRPIGRRCGTILEPHVVESGIRRYTKTLNHWGLDDPVGVDLAEGRTVDEGNGIGGRLVQIAYETSGR